ncbi:hypothetical protein V7127_25715 [Bacillus sp. JJ1773]|uniref:hypothetical protein n=1 Tax=Bacillus sp. JJ1773 TaxID=3122965 RepID=UPI003000A012
MSTETKKGLTDVQLKVIEKVVSGESSIIDCLNEVQVSKSTYYYWLKYNQEFQNAMEKECLFRHS